MPVRVNPAPLYTRAFWLACCVHLTGAMAHGMFLLFPLYVRQLGGDELAIGLVLGCAVAASVLCRPLVGTLLDRWGRREVLLWGTAVFAASFGPFLLVHTTGPALYALAGVHMVAAGALFAGYFTYAADLVPPARRVEGLAIFGVAGMAPNGLGPALGEVVIARAGWPAFFATATAFALLSLALIARLPRRHAGAVPAEHAALRDVGPLLRRGGLGRVLVATVVFGAGINAAFYFVAPYTRDLGLAHAAPFFTAYATTTIVLRVFGRRLPDRVGAHPVAVPAFAAFAAGLALLCRVPAPGMLVLAGMACGAGHGTLFPVLNGLTVSRTPQRLHGTVVSLYTAALDAGAVVGTPLCGALAQRFGWHAMWGTMAVASLAGLVLLLADRRRTRRVAPSRIAAAAVVALLLLPERAPAAWPDLASGPLQDNSFLVEEAYNQEPGVVQHIVLMHWHRESKDWTGAFTQEWPLVDERHQLSFTIPFTFAGAPEESNGVEDVLLNYRWGAVRESGSRPAVAPRASLVLPTGSVRDRRGAGGVGVELALAVSKQLAWLAAHGNVGTRIVPRALAPHGRVDRLVSWFGGVGLDWLVADAVNPLVELVASRDEEIGVQRVVRGTRVVVSPGVRVGWNGPGGTQWVGGAAVPCGLTRDTEDLGVLLYFSLEHGFTREATGDRAW
jgi:MFS family permease